ncbi:class I SAM-dependent methyltransferase, partial [Thermodesulfobacteriota bacterium]
MKKDIKMLLGELKEYKRLMDEDVNIIHYLKNRLKTDYNTTDMIQISYDLQAGKQIKTSRSNPHWEKEYSSAYAKILNRLGKHCSILEVGVGEGINLYNVLSRMTNTPSIIYGFDISYSKVKYARCYIQKKKIKNATLFMGDLFNAAFQDNSIDIIYTHHSIEANGGREIEALSELYRITNKYLVLFEPMYELASNESKKYMERHGYVRNLYSTAIKLGFKVIEHKILFESNPLSLNNWGVLILEKDKSNKTK